MTTKDPVCGMTIEEQKPAGSAEHGRPARSVRAGDIVLTVNGKPITDTRALVSATAALAPGTCAQLTIARAGKQSTVAVELGRRPAPQRRAAISPRR